MHISGVVFKVGTRSDRVSLGGGENHLKRLSSHFYCTSSLENIFQSHNRSSDEEINGKGIIVKYNPTDSSLNITGDQLGIAPLNYFLDSDQFIFSTQLSSLIALIDRPIELNQSAVADFLLYGRIDHSDKTLMAGIHRIIPAQSLTLDIHNWQLTKYVNPYFKVKQDLQDFETLADTNRSEIRQYIQKRIGEGIQGVLLSGGIDSSIIADQLAQQVSPKNLHFYTLSQTNEAIDETQYAQLIHLKHPEVKWTKVGIKKNKFLEDTEDLHRIIEWPTLSIGTYNQYQLLKECSANNINSIWDGLGADALYGGHDYYRYQLIKEYLYQLRINAAIEVLRWRGLPIKESQRAIRYHIKNSIFKYKWSYRYFLKWKNEFKIYNPHFLKEFLGKETDRRSTFIKEVKGRMNIDFFNGGVSHLSRFTDRISSQMGLQMIYPYAENVKWAKKISQYPTETLYHKGVPKAVLRHSFKNELPKEILNRKDKMGLPGPNNEWIDSEKEVWISFFKNELSGIYDLDYINANYKKWWNIASAPENYRHFRHISFAIWYKVWIANQSTSSPTDKS